MIQKRIVIDTNVCLDLFVFRDPRWAALLNALRSGELEAVTRDDCRTEWLKVLEYRHLPLDEQSRPGAISAFDELIACLLPQDMSGRSDVRLPVCTDRDDQKFLELARDSSAAILVTKDKALLKLAKRTSKAGMFQIMTPEKWTASWSSAETARTAHG
jgi:putative PIN family toxin of toxin-antitoxin system